MIGRDKPKGVDSKRCFLQWFALTLSYVVAAYFAFVHHIPQTVFYADTTYMTSVIAAVFVAAVAYLGFASFRYSDHTPTIAGADSNLGHVAVYITTLLGIFGTVIGIAMQLKAMGALDMTNSQSVTTFMTAFVAGMSTAVYSTAYGVIASIGTYLQCANIDYFLDKRP